MPRASVSRWVRLAAFGASYLALARLSDWFTEAQSDFTTFWPAAGLSVAALLLSTARDWPWLLGMGAACGLAASLLGGRPLSIAAVDAGVDAGEAFMGAWLVRRLVAVRPSLGSLKEAIGLVALCAGLSAGLAAFPAALAFWARNPSRDYLSTWMEWWIGDALGILVVAPFLLSWAGWKPRFAPGRRGARIEAVALFATLGITTFLVFGAGRQVTLSRQYLVFPPLLWAALRFGVRGASLASLVLAGLAASAGAAGLLAPRALAPLGRDVQGAVGVTVAGTLLLAAALAERARAQRALGERDALFSLFMRHSPAFLLLSTANGRTVGMSDSLARVAAPPGAAGRYGEEMAPAPVQSPAIAHHGDEHVLATGEPTEVAVEHSGRSLHFMKFLVPRGERPPLVGTVGLDLTEQRSAERALRLSQFALDHASDAVLFLDPDGRASYANQAAARLLGRPPALVVGNPVWNLDAAFDEQGWAGRWLEVTARGSLVMTGALVGADGSRHEVEAGLAYLASAGREWCIYTARSLADRRRAEAALRMASLGTLAAGVAHEINNPLASMAANVSFASGALKPLVGRPEVEEALGALRDAAEGAWRVDRIVRDLSVLSHAEQRQRTEADLHLEIRAAIAMAQDEIRNRARLELRLDPAPLVWASPTQLSRVFLNLLLNAAHAIPQGQADRHTIGVACYTASDGRAAVEVADTGVGMAPAVRHRIFEPFFTTKPFGTGAGLGLSICHGIVSGLGGEIEVESQEGLGSLFRVLLPAASDRTPGEPPPPAAS